MSRAQDVVERAIKDLESEAKRARTEIDKQRKDLEKRLKPLQAQLSDLEDALRRLVRREARKPAAKKKRAASSPAPRGANKRAILAALKKQPGASVTEVAAATGIKRTVVSSSLTQFAKRGDVKRTKRGGRVKWTAAD